MTSLVGHPQAMLTEIYIEALLVNEGLADQVWEAWVAGEISTYWVAWMWWAIVGAVSRSGKLMAIIFESK